jgi:hypothetical protein
MVNQLNELVKICGINDIDFTMTKEGDENSVVYLKEEKKFLVNVIDGEDKELEILLTNKINELKEMFQ